MGESGGSKRTELLLRPGPCFLGVSYLEEVHNYKSERELEFSALLTGKAPEVELALV